MFDFMLLILIGFIGIVFYLARLVVLKLEQKADEDVLRAKDIYQDIIDEKIKVMKERDRLEKEAAQIFTLYEMTKEITKNFDEHQAFMTFKRKLQENISLEECLLIDEIKDESEFTHRYEGYVVFALKSIQTNLGYLLYKGVKPQDRDKFAILGHQFALAMRRIKLYRDVERLAITDSLTGLYTRRYFSERFHEEIQRVKVKKISLCFLMIDVDRFKVFNDTHGHLTGDKVLKEVAKIIKENIREIDIAGRYGGEEFCVVLPDTETPGALQVAERMRQTAEKRLIKAYDQTIQLTISIGISTCPQDGLLAEELIDKADWALYRAKSQGRNSVCVFGAYQK